MSWYVENMLNNGRMSVVDIKLTAEWYLAALPLPGPLVLLDHGLCLTMASVWTIGLPGPWPLP
jgi:hypothetical protein